MMLSGNLPLTETRICNDECITKKMLYSNSFNCDRHNLQTDRTKQ